MESLFIIHCHNFYYNVYKESNFAAASFVVEKYINHLEEVLKIGWLTIGERRELSLL